MCFQYLKKKETKYTKDLCSIVMILSSCQRVKLFSLTKKKAEWTHLVWLHNYSPHTKMLGLMHKRCRRLLQLSHETNNLTLKICKERALKQSCLAQTKHALRQWKRKKNNKSGPLWAWKMNVRLSVAPYWSTHLNTGPSDCIRLLTHTLTHTPNSRRADAASSFLARIS